MPLPGSSSWNINDPTMPPTLRRRWQLISGCLSEVACRPLRDTYKSTCTDPGACDVIKPRPPCQVWTQCRNMHHCQDFSLSLCLCVCVCVCACACVCVCVCVCVCEREFSYYYQMVKRSKTNFKFYSLPT